MHLVVTPAVGSCIYSCIALSRMTDEQVQERRCVWRYANGVARDDARAKYEKELASKVAAEYKNDVNAEKTPDESEYEAIAKATEVTLDVCMFYAGNLVHFYVNEKPGVVVKVLYSGKGGEGLRDSKGHFDFISMVPPNLSHNQTDPSHRGFGV